MSTTIYLDEEQKEKLYEAIERIKEEENYNKLSPGQAVFKLAKVYLGG